MAILQDEVRKIKVLRSENDALRVRNEEPVAKFTEYKEMVRMHRKANAKLRKTSP